MFSWEPTIALDGGEDGLLFYKQIVNACENTVGSDLKYILLEIGFNQSILVNNLFESLVCSSETIKDLGGRDRVCNFNITNYYPKL